MTPQEKIFLLKGISNDLARYKRVSNMATARDVSNKIEYVSDLIRREKGEWVSKWFSFTLIGYRFPLEGEWVAIDVSITRSPYGIPERNFEPETLITFGDFTAGGKIITYTPKSNTVREIVFKFSPGQRTENLDLALTVGSEIRIYI